VNEESQGRGTAVSQEPHDTSTARDSRSRRLSVLLPAATFLVGLALGAALIWIAQSDGDAPEAGTDQSSPGSTVSPSPEPSGTGGIAIPEACLRAAEAAEELVSIGREAVSAVADLDAVRLQEVVNDIERLDGRVREDAADCRAQSRS